MSMVYKPLVSNEVTVTVFEVTIEDRIKEACGWLSSLYQYSDQYGFQKEYPGIPLSIYVKNTGEWRPLGERAYVITPEPAIRPFAKFSDVKIGKTSESFYVGFEDGNDWDYDEPLLYVTKEYSYDGKIVTKIQFVKYGGVSRSDVYLGDEVIFSNVGSDTPSKTYTETTYGWTRPAHRYTVRHAAQLCEKIFYVFGIHNDGVKLRSLRDDFGFTYDIYDPLFKKSVEYDVFYFYTDQAYRDCDVYTRLPRGLYPHRYPYWSKVCLNRRLYIELSKNDPLIRGLISIHVLNKGLGPDWKNWSARAYARWLESACWNGYGIAHPLNRAHASCVRTAVFLALETLLGYKYGDATSRAWADRCASIAQQVQWGVHPFPRYCGAYADLGTICRPQYQGSFFINWVPSSPLYKVPVATSWIDYLDFLGLPPEEPGVIPSNTESTAVMLQALRIYLYYKYGVAYPNNRLLP
jgi:hypothetical protein